MNRLYRFALIITTLVALFSCSNKNIDETKNLAINGSFENVTDGVPDGWRIDVFNPKNRRVNISVEQGNAYSGEKCAVIENIDIADSKLVQRISVSPKSFYKLSAWIKTENVPEGKVGANISVLPIIAFTPSARDTKGTWQLVELYGITGPEQNYIDVACRIGMYGEEDTGKAWFDDFGVYAVKEIPAGKTTRQFYEEKSAQAENLVPKSIKDARAQTNADFWIILLSIVFIIVFAFVYRTFLKKDRFGIGNKTGKVTLFLILILVAAFLLRLVLGYFLESMEIDVGLYKWWGNNLLQKPWSEYYDYFSAYNHTRTYNQTIQNFFCDYPPVYIMILGFVAFIKNIFHFDERMFTLLIKSTNIICDMVTCILIFRIARRKLNDAAALGLTFVYAFNPAVIVNSAIWGQADSIYTLLAFLIVETILSRRFWLGGLILAFALLIKVQTAFIAFALLYSLVEEKSITKWATTIGVGLVTFVLLILPFAIKLPPDWIIVQLIGTLSGYPFASVDAYNFFALFGANWNPSNAPFLFGISADIWGIALGYIFLVFSAFIYFFSTSKSKNYFSGLFVISVIFMFIPGMHERYLYAAAIFSLMAFVYEKDKRFLFLLLGFSITIFINVYHILDVFIVAGIAHIGIPDYPRDPLASPFLLGTSLANLLLFIYMVYVGVDIYILKKVKPIKEKIRITKPIAEQVVADLPATTESGVKAVESGTANIIAEAAIPVTPEAITTAENAALPITQEVIPPPMPQSKFRNIIFAIGLLSVVVPTFGFVAWRIGLRELKRFPDDAKVRAGWALGLGMVVIIATGLVLAIIAYPALKSAGFIK
jgi:dolichyl-phosphate-mannose-protein mannosyltransferase